MGDCARQKLQKTMQIKNAPQREDYLRSFFSNSDQPGRPTHTGQHRAVAEEVWPHTVSNHIFQHLQRALGLTKLDVSEESRAA